MKKILTRLFSIVLVCTIITGVNIPIQKNVQASAKQQNKKAMKAYKKKLSSKKIAWGSDVYLDNSESKFAKLDINGDGVKELIVQSNVAAHMDGYIRIFTYKNGKVKSLAHFTAINIYKNKKLIKDEYSNHGCSITKYYQFSKNGKLKKTAQENCDMWVRPSSNVGPIHAVKTSDGMAYYYGWKWNGKKVSYKTYRSRLKKLKKNAKKSKLKYYQNTKGNRNRYLK